jgi:hypothetical protein
MPSPSTALDNALYTKITTDATLITLQSTRLYKGMADAGATYPFTLTKVVSEVPRYTLGGVETYRILYEFKAYDDGESGADWRDTQAITDRLDAILTDGTLTITGFTLRYCRLELRFDMAEEKEGIIYPVTISQFGIEVN